MESSGTTNYSDFEIQKIYDEAVQEFFSESVSLSKIEIPKPTIKKSASGNYILWGENHSFIQTLIKTLEKSSIHNTAVRYKADLYAGETWKIINQNELTDQEIQKVNAYLSRVNVRQESIIDVLQKVCIDLSLTGNGYIEIHWQNGKILELYRVDASCLAPEEISSDGNIYHYGFSNNWAQARREEYKPVSIPAAFVNPPKGKQIIHIKLNETTGELYYSMPDYLPALDLIALQSEIGAFWLNFVQSGCFATMAVGFPNGIPKDEIKAKIKADLKRLYEGRNRQSIFVSYANNKDGLPVFQNLATPDLDKSFTIVNQIVNESISTAHRITNQRLFGIASSGAQLGQKDELLESFQILMNTVIYKVQVKLERIINKILEINGFKARIELVENTPIKFQFSQEILKDILSKDELRQLINYAPISEDKKLTPSLAEINGVGGTQSAITVITDPILTSGQKISFLVKWFGLSLEDAKYLIEGDSTSTDNNSNPNPND